MNPSHPFVLHNGTGKVSHALRRF